MAERVREREHERKKEPGPFAGLAGREFSFFRSGNEVFCLRRNAEAGDPERVLKARKAAVGLLLDADDLEGAAAILAFNAEKVSQHAVGAMEREGRMGVLASLAKMDAPTVSRLAGAKLALSNRGANRAPEARGKAGSGSMVEARKGAVKALAEASDFRAARRIIALDVKEVSEYSVSLFGEMGRADVVGTVARMGARTACTGAKKWFEGIDARDVAGLLKGAWDGDAVARIGLMEVGRYSVPGVSAMAASDALDRKDVFTAAYIACYGPEKASREIISEFAERGRKEVLGEIAYYGKKPAREYAEKMLRQVADAEKKEAV